MKISGVHDSGIRISYRSVLFMYNESEDIYVDMLHEYVSFGNTSYTTAETLLKKHPVFNNYKQINLIGYVQDIQLKEQEAQFPFLMPENKNEEESVICAIYVCTLLEDKKKQGFQSSLRRGEITSFYNCLVSEAKRSIWNAPLVHQQHSKEEELSLTHLDHVDQDMSIVLSENVRTGEFQTFNVRITALIETKDGFLYDQSMKYMYHTVPIGGRMHIYESVATALKRELQEELSLSNQAIQHYDFLGISEEVFQIGKITTQFLNFTYRVYVDVSEIKETSEIQMCCYTYEELQKLELNLVSSKIYVAKTLNKNYQDVFYVSSYNRKIQNIYHSDKICTC